MKYKLINKTKYPTDVLKSLIEFSAPKGIKKVTVIMMYDNNGAAWRANADTFKKNKIIRVWIQKNINRKTGFFPKFSNSKAAEKAGYKPTFLLRNEYEVIVALIAHELRHIWQNNVSKQNFLRTKLVRYNDWHGPDSCLYKMERDSCQYAKKILNKYRKVIR